MKTLSGSRTGAAIPNRSKVGTQQSAGNAGKALDSGNVMLRDTPPLRNGALMNAKQAGKPVARASRRNDLIDNGIPAPGASAHAPRIKADLRNKAIPSKASNNMKKKPGPNSVGDALAKLLRARQVKQTELASAVGVSGSAVHHWITGNVMPTSKHIKAAADFFDVSIEVFYPPRLKPALTAEQWRSMSR